MSTTESLEVLDTLATQVTALVAEHDGRLAWIRVTAPAALADHVDRELPQRLAAHGIDFVDVDVSPDEDAAPRILEHRFDGGWA